MHFLQKFQERFQLACGNNGIVFLNGATVKLIEPTILSHDTCGPGCEYRPGITELLRTTLMADLGLSLCKSNILNVLISLAHPNIARKTHTVSGNCYFREF